VSPSHNKLCVCLVFCVSVVSHLWTPAAAQENIFVITSVPDVNVTLNCAAKMKPGLQYYAVRWYKETGVPRLSGLVSKTLPDGQMMWYVDADTRVSLEEETLNLRLPTVTCSDQAVYQCYLAAPVGEQNRKGRVRLSVTGKPYTVRENLILCGAMGLLLSALMVALFSFVSVAPRESI
uniref:Ig-like domain-containing protein n=1 Tax=Periophthalmus magnuspinnatus TaxID=409849 RepID=A0A3B4AAW2_9GOBI